MKCILNALFSLSLSLALTIFSYFCLFSFLSPSLLTFAPPPFPSAPPRTTETARQVSAIMAGSDNKMYLDAESLMINVADSTGSTKRLKDFGPK